MIDQGDYWTDESFEDMITRTFIALYENTLDHHSMRGALNAITADDLVKIRKQSVFIPAPDRLVWSPTDPRGQKLDDQLIIPTAGCISLGEDRNESDPDHLSSYCRIQYFRRIARLPFSVRQIGAGTPYESVLLFPQDKGTVEGIREYVTVNEKTKTIMPCIHRAHGKQLQRSIYERLNGAVGRKTELCLNMSFQLVDDFRHQWRITAETGESKVVVGAYAENVKSLLYARELPMTASGRKRPILHVVSAHRRRMKAGTEIDIKQFLRGTREITMDGTRFVVDVPDRYYEQLEAEGRSW